MLLAPALAVPLVVGSISTASADSNARPHVIQKRAPHGTNLPVRHPFSRTWS